MVTKEQLVCTKEQAVMLKVKGAPQRSLFAWTEVPDRRNGGSMNILDDNYGSGWAAFTTPEMTEQLPKMGRIKRFFFVLKTGLDPVKVADHLIRSL